MKLNTIKLFNYSVLLIVLWFVIYLCSHSENTRTNISIVFGLPGYLGMLLAIAFEKKE